MIQKAEPTKKTHMRKEIRWPAIESAPELLGPRAVEISGMISYDRTMIRFPLYQSSAPASEPPEPPPPESPPPEPAPPEPPLPALLS